MRVNLLSVVLVNIGILIFGVVFIEVGTRVCLVIKNHCELSLLKNPGPIDQDQYRSLCEYSSILGYVPIKNARLNIDIDEHWKGSDVTINRLGFRVGINADTDMEKPILVAGDSFVFGHQVGDDKTWPAYLQKAGYNVFNLGVSGYGTAQSLLRLKTFIKNNKIKPNVVILQTLVGYDFIRDSLDFRTGFPSTALYKDKSGEIQYYCPKFHEIDIAGSKYSSLNVKKGIPIKVSEYLRSINILAKDKIEIYQKRLTRKYEHALNKEAIIDFVLSEFKKLPYQKIFLLQYGGLDTPNSTDEREYLLNRLKELDLTYIDTYMATRDKKGVMKELYIGHHTAEGNKAIADYILGTGLLDQFGKL